MDMKNTIMSLDQFKDVTPSVFATSASPKVSSKYTFVPTIDIVENFDRQGWTISSVRQSGKSEFGIHELRFRNGELPKVGDSLAEVIIRNSHNGKSALNITAGLFRVCCSNGLTVPTALSERFNLRHTGFDLGEVKRLTEKFAERLPIIQNSVDRMMSRELSDEEKIKFVIKSTEMRWKMGSVPTTLNLEDFLTPNREEDKGNSLWKVFNVVQEKFIRGGVEYNGQSGRKTGLKGIKNIVATNHVNTKLWEIAEEIM
jgi:hypothetical protein